MTYVHRARGVAVVLALSTCVSCGRMSAITRTGDASTPAKDTGGVRVGAEAGGETDVPSESGEPVEADLSVEADVPDDTSAPSDAYAGDDVTPDAGAACSRLCVTGVCTDEGSGVAACVDDWAEWKMPNSQVDVSAGAPNLESYTDNGDGTVTDDVTRLMWQRIVSSTGYTLATAVSYCAGSNLGGYADWRLPSIIELVSIVDPGTFLPAIDRTYFPNTASSAFWSSSPSQATPGEGFDVPFDAGNVSLDEVSSPFLARCVRSTTIMDADAAGEERYVDSNGTVYDAKTALTWQETPAVANYAEADAESYCSSLVLNGSGWRLPTMKELATLVDFSLGQAPVIDATVFPSTPADEFWTATLFAGGAGRGLGVDFSYGLTYTTSANIVYNVRCVR